MTYQFPPLRLASVPLHFYSRMETHEDIARIRIEMSLLRQLAAETLGAALLTAISIGSSMTALYLESSPMAALMSGAIAGGLGLFALLACFGNISGAHFNPVLSLSESWRGGLSPPSTAAYIAAQCIGAFAGVAAAHFMFNAPLFEAATIARSGPSQWASEYIATFSLIGICIGASRHRSDILPYAVCCYVIAALLFTPSAAFMNPAITLAKAATASPTGIRPSDVPGFVLAQLCGGMSATWLFQWLYPTCPVRHAKHIADLPSLMPVTDALPKSR